MALDTRGNNQNWADSVRYWETPGDTGAKKAPQGQWDLLVLREWGLQTPWGTPVGEPGLVDTGG